MSENADDGVKSLSELTNALQSVGTQSSPITVKLGADLIFKETDMTPIIKSYTTLDLNKHTITITESGSDNHGKLVVADNAVEAKITNGTIIYSGTGENKSTIRVGSIAKATESPNHSSVELTDLNIISKGYGVSVFGNVDLTVNNSNITAVSSAIATNGNSADKPNNSCGSKITINGGQYTSTDTAAIFFPGGSTLDVNGGTFTGKTGFDIRSGTVAIDNATINVFGSPNDQKLTKDKDGKIVAEMQGPTPWGMGIAVFNLASYGQAADTTYTTLSVTVNNTPINNAVYNVYIGDYKIVKNGTDTTKGTFDAAKISETYKALHAQSAITVNGAQVSDMVNIDTESKSSPCMVSGSRSNDALVPLTIDINKADRFIFANGEIIKISSGSDNKNSKITYGSDPGTVFVDNFDLSKFTVFGGFNNDSEAIESTNITMDGGKVYGIAGGGYGAADVTESNVTVTGGTATYVTGGGWSTDSSTTAATTNAMTNKTTTTKVTISGGNVNYALGGGRLGYTYVEIANLTINGGEFKEIVAGGVNGYTGTATLTINSTSKVTANLVASGNRGEVSEANVKIQSIGTGEIKYVAIGALKGTTSTDGGPNAMFDKISFEISEDIKISGSIYLGGSKWMKNGSPSTNPWDSDRTDALGETNITINAEGRTIIAGDVTSDVGSGVVAVKSNADYTIGIGKTWTFNGCTLNLGADDSSSIENNGTIKYIGKEGDAAVTNGLEINGYGGNVIVDNINFEGGFGLYVHDAADVTVINCEFKNMDTKTSAASGELVNAIRIEKCTGDVTIGGANSANKITDIHPNGDLAMYGAGIYVNNCGSSGKTLNVSYNEITNVAYNALQLTGLKFSNIDVEYNAVTEWDCDNDGSGVNVGKGRAIRMSVSNDVESEPSISISNNTFVKEYDVNKKYDDKNILKATKGYNGDLTPSPTFSDNTVTLTYKAESEISSGFVIISSDAFGIENVSIIFDGVNFTTKGLFISGADAVTIKDCTFTNISSGFETADLAGIVLNMYHPAAIHVQNTSGKVLIEDNSINGVNGDDGVNKKFVGISVTNLKNNTDSSSIEIKDNDILGIDHNAVYIFGKYSAISITDENKFSEWDKNNDSVNSVQDKNLAGGRAIRIDATNSSITISDNIFVKKYDKTQSQNAVIFGSDLGGSTNNIGYDDGNILKISNSTTVTFADNVLNLTGIEMSEYLGNNLFNFDENTPTHHIILFNANGGLFDDEGNVLCSITTNTISQPDNPSRSSYKFNGWYSDLDLTTPFTDFTIPFSNDTTLYAKWTYTGGSGGVPITPPDTDKPVVKEEEVKNDDGTISSITETTTKKENADGSKETTVKKEEVVKDESGNVQSVIEEKQSEVVSKDGSVNKTSETTVKDSTGKVVEEKTEIEIEDKNTGVSTSVEIKKDSEGKTTSEIKTEASIETKDGKAQVDSEALEEALKQAEAAKKTAEEKGAKNVTPVIEIEAENSKDFTETQISTDDLSKLAEAEVEVKIKTATGEVNLPPEVSKSLSSNTDEKVSLSFGEADKQKLTEEQKKTVGDSPVFEFNLKSGDKDIHDLGGTAKVTVPYELKKGEDPNKITVWYIDESGKPVAMKSVYDPETKSITFETSHFSYYFIAEDAAAPDDSKDDSSNNSIYYAVAAIIVILIIIALAYYFMKKKQ